MSKSFESEPTRRVSFDVGQVTKAECRTPVPGPQAKQQAVRKSGSAFFFGGTGARCPKAGRLDTGHTVAVD